MLAVEEKCEDEFSLTTALHLPCRAPVCSGLCLSAVQICGLFESLLAAGDYSLAGVCHTL